MAREIGPIEAVTGNANLYVLLYNKELGSDYNKIRDVVADAWDALLEADIGDYDIAVTEIGTSGQYFADLPAGLAMGTPMWWACYDNAGGAPAWGQAFIASGMIATPAALNAEGLATDAVTEITDAAAVASTLLLQATTIATLASQTSFTLTAGSADDDAYNGAVCIITDVTTGTQKAMGKIKDYVGSSKTVELEQDPGVFTMAATDKIDIFLGGLDKRDTGPASQEPVADEHTIPLIHTTSGWIGSRTLYMQTGEVRTIACDFAARLAVGGRLASLDTVEIQTGTAGGVTSSILGVDRALGNAKITAVTAGTYVVRWKATDNGDGGSLEGDLTIVVVAA